VSRFPLFIVQCFRELWLAFIALISGKDSIIFIPLGAPLHPCKAVYNPSPHSALSHPFMLCIFLKSIHQVQSTNPSDIICSLLSDYSIQSWEITILPHPIWEHMFGHF
jgi:hypothetical protein